MKRFIGTTVALAAAFAMVTSPAFADEGRWHPRVRNPADPAAELLAGREVCLGSATQFSCMTLNRQTQEIHIVDGSRPIGVSQNVIVNRVVAATATGLFARDSGGRLIPAVADVRGTENAAARWTSGFAQVPAAAANGLGASLVSSLTTRCHGEYGCGNNFNMNNGNAGAVADSFSGSTSTAVVQQAGGCTTGACKP